METKIKRLQRKIDKLREAISEEVGNSTMDLIEELVECEILLEQECNK
jgi:hypothetical protein